MSAASFPLLDLIDRQSRPDSQCGRVLAELSRGRRLRKWDIIHELRALNAGRVISDLRHGRHDGVKYDIRTDMVEIKTVDGKADVAEYVLVK
jgi:hypothetical protein